MKNSAPIIGSDTVALCFHTILFNIAPIDYVFALISKDVVKWVTFVR
jgi:hypothetical protein